MKGTRPHNTAPATGEFIPAKAPDHLNKYAADVWQATITDLETGGRKIPQEYTQAFLGFCHCSGTVRECDEVLAREGMVVDGGREGPKRHPLIVVKNSALLGLRGYAESLGLTPASAGRLPT